MINQNEHPSITFLKLLYKNCTQGFFNLRLFASNRFIPLSQLDSIPSILETHRGDNICFSPVTRQKGNNSKSGIVEIPGIYVDLNKVVFEKGMEGFPLKPTIIVDSGDRYQCYWLPKEPATKKDLARVEDILRRLGNYFDSGVNFDTQKTFPLPGTLNHRQNPPCEVILREINPGCEYDIEDFDFLLQAETTKGEDDKSTSAGKDKSLLEDISTKSKDHDSLEINSPPPSDEVLPTPSLDEKRVGGQNDFGLPHESDLPITDHDDPLSPDERSLSSLCPAHLENLRKDGLSDETIKKAGIYSVRPGDINKKLSFNDSRIKSAMAFPYPGCDGFEVCKVFPPRDGLKYAQPKGSPNRLYIPHLVEAILSSPSIPINLTEGIKKALKACQEGLPCIAMSGLWNWSDGSEEKKLIPDFDRINLEGRTVDIVPDIDWEQPNRHGEPRNLRQAVYELAYRLIDRGAKVFIVELPQGPDKGFDDYLCNHTVDEFKVLPKRGIRKQTIEEMIEQAAIETLPEILKRIANLKETERAIYINALAKKLKVRKSVIEKDLVKLTRHGEPDIDRLLESGANPESHYSAQNFIDGILSFGAILGDQRIIVKSDGEIVLANGDNFRFKRSALTAEAIKRFLNGEDISGRDLVERLKSLFSDHVIFRDDRIPLLLSIWVVGTYIFKIFRFYGYLFVNSPVKRCGKSLLLDILSFLCFNSTPRMINPSESSTFREVHNNDVSLIIDEVESLSNADREKRSEMISLLNDGFQRNGQVSRTETKNREFVVCYFNAYCPKVLAGIKGIADTLEDRSFKITMVRKAKGELVNRFNLRALESHIKKIREDLFIWALKHGTDVAEVYGELTEVPGTERFDDRLKDILEPLLSIASVIDTQANDNTIPTVKGLISLSKNIGKGREASEDLNNAIPAAVAAMRSLLDGIDERFISADELFEKFREQDDLGFVQSKRGMAFFLSKLEIDRTQPRRMGEKTVRGYVLSQKHLDDLGARYA